MEQEGRNSQGGGYDNLNTFGQINPITTIYICRETF